jgi:hypothetical protein
VGCSPKTGSSAMGRWSEELGELHWRIAHRFPCSEVRERVKRYLLRLLGRVERLLSAGNSPRPPGSEIHRGYSDC